MSTAEQGELEPADKQAFHPGFGQGGVPWFLLLMYVSYLVFLAWYFANNHLPHFLQRGPGQTPPAIEQPATK